MVGVLLIWRAGMAHDSPPFLDPSLGTLLFKNQHWTASAIFAESAIIVTTHAGAGLRVPLSLQDTIRTHTTILDASRSHKPSRP